MMNGRFTFGLREGIVLALLAIAIAVAVAMLHS
jgi:hypothetical protein